VALLLFVSTITEAQSSKTVAVLNPICRDNSVPNIYLSIVRGSFESVATATQGYDAFDRSALDAILQEHNFQRSGAVDDEEIRQIGRFSGVDYVLVTDVSADEGYMMIVAKILNVETAKYDRAVDGLMDMNPPEVKSECTALAQELFQFNMSTGTQTGEMIWKGKRYVGEYKDGKPNGKGKLYGDDESGFVFYEGDFLDGERNGYGVVIAKDGTKFEGNWVNGSIDGNGKILFSNGFCFEGTFHNNNLSQGTMTHPSGEKYIGALENFMPNGFGTCYYSNGNKYVGKWVDGAQEGDGIFYWTNGNRYEGHFTNDKQNGEGILYDRNGIRWIGTWKMGVMHGIFDVYSGEGQYHVKIVNGEITDVIE
jgi:hypothetical protein